MGVVEAGKALIADVNRDITNIRNLELTNNCTITNHDGNTSGLILGNTLVTATASELNVLDGITASTSELNVLDGITASTSELNVLDGITATTNELNYIDTTPGTAEANKALVVDANLDIIGIHNIETDNLTVNGTLITASATEINYNDLATIGTAEAGKALVVDVNRDISNIRNLTATNLNGTIQTVSQPYITTIGTLDSLSSNGNVNITQHNGSTTGLQLNGTLITATANEINKLDGVTATTAEINTLAGITATTNEINKLSGVTASTAELNILDGVTATYAEINVLDGITATTTELNYVDITTIGTAEASKALIVDSNKDISGINSLSVTSLLVNGASISTNGTTPPELSGVTAGTASASKALVLDSSRNITNINSLTTTSLITTNLTLGSTAVTATAAELNKLSGVTSTTTEINTLAGVTAGTASASKALILDASKNITNINSLTTTSLTTTSLTTTNLTLGGTAVTATATELNYNDITTIGTAEASKALVLDSSRNITNINAMSLTGQLSTTIANDTSTLVTYQTWKNDLATDINVVMRISNVGSTFGNASSNPLRFITNNYNRITIDENGNVDIIYHNGSTTGLELGGTLVTATAAELNYNDITTIGTAEASKALITDASRNISNLNSLSITTTDANCLSLIHI